MVEGGNRAIASRIAEGGNRAKARCIAEGGNRAKASHVANDGNRFRFRFQEISAKICKQLSKTFPKNLKNLRNKRRNVFEEKSIAMRRYYGSVS